MEPGCDGGIQDGDDRENQGRYAFEQHRRHPSDRIYVIPTVGHVWGNRTTEQPLVILWMMNKLYPDVMTDAMLAEEISYFYSHFFQTQLTDSR